MSSHAKAKAGSSMADDQISLTALQALAAFLGSILTSVFASLRAVMGWFARRERDIRAEIATTKAQVAANNIAVAVLQAQGVRIENALERIDKKQDRQMEILLTGKEHRA